MFGRTKSGRPGSGSAVLFFASIVPFGIAAHLVSEFAGLGWHDDGDVLFSARHGYLAAIAAALLVWVILAIRAVPASQRRARLAARIEQLPFHGKGLRFTALSFVAQFAFFALTQIGEGCPLCAGDVVVGVFAAAIAAIVGAIAIALGQRRFIALVFAIVATHCALSRALATNVRTARRRLPIALAATVASFSFRYRPPPQKAA